MDNNFDPKTCPIGVGNEKEIEHLGDRLDMAIERLTEKVSEMKEDIASLHNSMDQKFDAVDKRFDDMDEKLEKQIEKIKASIPQKVEEHLDKKRGSAATQAIKWIFCGVGGTILISILTAWIKVKLGL